MSTRSMSWMGIAFTIVHTTGTRLVLTKILRMSPYDPSLRITYFPSDISKWLPVRLADLMERRLQLIVREVHTGRVVNIPRVAPHGFLETCHGVSFRRVNPSLPSPIWTGSTLGKTLFGAAYELVGRSRQGYVTTV